MSELFTGREEEIEELETEIIKTYNNNPELKLPKVAEPLRIQEIFATASEYLGRVTEIHNECIRRIAQLVAAKENITAILLPIVDGSSADARKAQVDGTMQTIMRLLTLEEGLKDICEGTSKTLRNTEDMASRQLEALKIDLQYFNAAEYIQVRVDEARKKYGAKGLHGLD